jgi:hypothetical protein
MFPGLAKKEQAASTREQGQIPSWNFSASEAVYGRKEVAKPERLKVATTYDSLSRVPGLKPIKGYQPKDNTYTTWWGEVRNKGV